MRLGISTACFYPQPIEETMERIAALGFRIIEIFFNTESEYDISFLNHLKNTTEQLGIRIVSIHPYTSLMEGMMLFFCLSTQNERRICTVSKIYGGSSLSGRRVYDIPWRTIYGRGGLV